METRFELFVEEERLRELFLDVVKERKSFVLLFYKMVFCVFCLFVFVCLLLFVTCFFQVRCDEATSARGEMSKRMEAVAEEKRGLEQRVVLLTAQVRERKERERCCDDVMRE
jgi:hypothetical protein